MGKKHLSFGEANFNKLYANYKRNCIKISRDFLLTEDEFKSLTKQSCYYCGRNPIQIKNEKGLNREYTYNGIDRVDNSKGYTAENCVPCCKLCNIAKRAMSKIDFLNWAERVYNYSIVRNLETQ